MSEKQPQFEQIDPANRFEWTDEDEYFEPSEIEAAPSPLDVRFNGRPEVEPDTPEIF